MGCHFLLQRVFRGQRSGTCVSCLADRFFTNEPPSKPPVSKVHGWKARMGSYHKFYWTVGLLLIRNQERCLTFCVIYPEPKILCFIKIISWASCCFYHIFDYLRQQSSLESKVFACLSVLSYIYVTFGICLWNCLSLVKWITSIVSQWLVIILIFDIFDKFTQNHILKSFWPPTKSGIFQRTSETSL